MLVAGHRLACLDEHVESAGPVNAFILWKSDAVRVTCGADQIGTYNKTPQSFRKWCKTCGGHVFTGHPGWGLTDVYADVIMDFPFRAGVHVHYQETVLPMQDGLPKMKDLSTEMEGSSARRLKTLWEIEMRRPVKNRPVRSLQRLPELVPPDSFSRNIAP